MRCFEDRRTRRVFRPVDLRETRAFIQHVSCTSTNRQGASVRPVAQDNDFCGALFIRSDVIIIDGKEIDEPLLFSDKTKTISYVAGPESIWV